MTSFLISVIIVVITVTWYKRRHKNHIQKVFSEFTKVVEPTKPQYDMIHYVKKPFIFDTVSEFNLFPILDEIVSPDHYVFPQVNYSHLIQSKTGSYYEDRRYRSHIERKSADFVVCDKKTCAPQLVIALDGSVHSRPEIHERDIEIDEILGSIGLPILRLTNEESKNRELVKAKIQPLLN